MSSYFAGWILFCICISYLRLLGNKKHGNSINYFELKNEKKIRRKLKQEIKGCGFA